MGAENREKDIQSQKQEQEQKQKQGLDQLDNGWYRQLMGAMMPCIVFGTGIAWLIQMITEPNIYWYMDIGRWIGKLVCNIVVGYSLMAVGWLVLKQLDISIRWGKQGPSTLAYQVQHRRSISRGLVLGDIFFQLFFILVFLLLPQIFCGIFESGQEVIPVFNRGFIQATWGMVVILWGAGFLKSVCKLVYGHYNEILVGVTWLMNAISVGVTVGWLRRGELINPLLIQKLLTVIGTQEEIVIELLTNVQPLLLGVICFALLIESVEVLVRTLTPTHY